MVRSNIAKASIIGAVVTSIAICGTGVAAADEPARRTYGDVIAELSKAGYTPIVESRIGGSMPQDKCLVTRMLRKSRLGPGTSEKKQRFAIDKDVVMLALDCQAH